MVEPRLLDAGFGDASWPTVVGPALLGRVQEHSAMGHK